MTLNWGHKITLVFISFATLMGVLVYKSSNTKFHLVSKEYYKDELAYQQVIDASNRAAKDGITTLVVASNKQIKIQFSQNSIASNITGTALLYNASNDAFDDKLSFTTTNMQPAMIDFKKTIPKGSYTVKLFFSINGTSYYTTTNFKL